MSTPTETMKTLAALAGADLQAHFRAQTSRSAAGRPDAACWTSS